MKKLVKAAILSVLVAFVFEVAIKLLIPSQATHHNADLLPLTFYGLWALVAIAGTLFIVHRLRAKLEVFFVMLFASLFLGVLLKTVFPDPVRYLPASYYGFQVMDMGVIAGETVSSGLGSLYPRGSRQLHRRLGTLPNDEQFADLEPFMTWQAGLTRGYVPDLDTIPEYRDPKTWADSAALILSVGPVALVEHLITGIVRLAIPIVLIQIAWLAVMRDYVWWHEA